MRIYLLKKLRTKETFLFSAKNSSKRIFMMMLFSLFVFCSFTAYSQQKTISGKITEASTGEPVIGASIAIKGTSIGTVSDIEGSFTLNIPENARTLVVSYMGFISQELPIDKAQFDISMKEDVANLDEVVVIGYGTVRKRDLTGAISTIKGDAIAQVPVTNAAEAITGRLAGVRVTTTDGQPDAEIMIRVRGGGSINNDNSPLIIVDGFPVANFNHIPASDIEEFTVLKDASTTAIYGAQGANGVILITTKSPKAGRVTVSYNGFMQSKSLSKRMDAMGPYEYVKFNYELAALSNSITDFQKKFGHFEDMDLYKSQRGTDWQEDMFGNDVVSQQHQISITGGTDKTSFVVGGTYNKDGGLQPYSDYSRYSLNFKIKQELAKNLTFNFNSRVTDTETNGEGSSGSTDKVRTYESVTKGPVRGLEGMSTEPPIFATEEERDQWERDNMTFAERLFEQWRRRNQRSFAFDASLDWGITKGLTYRLEGGYTYGFNENKRYRGKTTTDAANNGGLPMTIWQKENTYRWRALNMLTYALKLEKDHKINIIMGQEVLSRGGNSNTITARGFSKELSPEAIFANITLAQLGVTGDANVTEPNNLASFFGRGDYNFKERYLLTLTMRADGSSRFAPGNQWGYFPAAAAKWRIAEESFMESTKTWLNELSFRLGYGEAGNNNIPAREFMLGYSISTSGNYAMHNSTNAHYVSNSRLPNPNITWESTVSRNLGLDFGLFNRVYGNVDVYWNTSSDLLLLRKITAPGYTEMWANIGQTSNKGVEVTLNGNILRNKNFSLDANFNIGFNKSNVDALDDDGIPLINQTGWASTDLRGYNEYEVRVGQSVGIIYGWITDGYYTTSDFAGYDEVSKTYILKEGVPASTGGLGNTGRIGIRPGTIKFKDIDEDGIIDDNDRVAIGDANPKFQGGFGFNGKFLRDFDFMLNFSFVYGNDIYNANKAIMSQQYRTNWPTLLNSMNSDGRYTYLADNGTIVTDLATLAAMNEGANAKQYWSPFSFGNSNAVVHSWLIEDGSFLRLQNVTLGYTLPNKLSSKFGAQALRAYCTLNNAWIWTNYSGYDPEVSSPGRGNTLKQLIPGLDYSGYPKSFSWTVGVNLTF